MGKAYFTSFIRRGKAEHKDAYRLNDGKKTMVVPLSSKATRKSVKIQLTLRRQALSGLKKLGL